jgi:hypothetical protein
VGAGRADVTVRSRSAHGFRLLFLFLVLATIVAQTACRDQDVVTASYATLAEAREAGALTRGEIPAGVPDGAYEIRTASDLDAPRKWGLFNFRPQDEAALRALLTAEEASLAGVSCDIPPRIEWWPVLLRGSIDAEQAKAAGLQSYRSKQGDLVVVVNWKQGRAYYWTAAAR